MNAHPSVSIAPEELEPGDAYRLMVSVVVPRPIAWVSTASSDGAPNLAPYSFFNGVAGPPPVVMFSVGQRPGGSGPKDTLRNVRDTGEFVVNLADETLFEPVNLSSGGWPYGTSEFEITGLTPVPSLRVRPPRVGEAPIALEATVTQIVPVEGTRYTMVLGRVEQFHIRAGLLRPDGLVDPELLRPIARLGGAEFSTLGRIVSMQRPNLSAAGDGET